MEYTQLEEQKYCAPKCNAAQRKQKSMLMEQNCKTQNHKPDKNLQVVRNRKWRITDDAPLLHDAHEEFYLPADKSAATGEQKSA
jgi:hypothetical protein